MRLFDLHNDIMTSLLALDEKKRHMQSFAREENDIIYAIWATKLDCEKFREYAKFLCDNSFMFAIEDAGAVRMCLLVQTTLSVAMFLVKVKKKTKLKVWS